MTKKPPLSLRVPDALLDRVAKWAAEQGIPRNAAYVDLIQRGLKSVGPHPGLNERSLPQREKDARTAEKKAAAPAVHVSVPVLERKAFNPRPKTGKAKP